MSQHPKVWAPDKLAAMGIQHGRTELVLRNERPTQDLLKWTKHQWDGTLLTYVEVELRCVILTLERLGVPSQQDYVEFVYRQQGTIA